MAQNIGEPQMNLSSWGKVLLLAAVLSITSIGSTHLYLTMTSRPKLVVATTTSLFDTGLLDEVEIQFEAKHNIDICFLSVGSGIAIARAQRGDADMILVHSPSTELEFLEGGYGVNRKIIAYNFFEIIGPASDPVEISGLPPIEALKKIASAGRNSQAEWVSRGDNSGTHSKEKTLWAAAGLNWTQIRDETNWFIETGSGMGNTLNAANQLEAYTLADKGTFLAYTNAISDLLPNLAELIIQGPQLLNVYTTISTNPSPHPQANFEGATTFTEYLLSEEGQQLIGEFGKDKYGQNLFNPAANIIRTGEDTFIAQMIKGYAFFGDSECPPQYRFGHPELYD